MMMMTIVAAEEEQILQDDPCLAKSKVVGDVQYCDRYWECEFGQPELYDCPNGLVWVGKNQGIADGCDYPWRHTNICKNKDLASKYILKKYVIKPFIREFSWIIYQILLLRLTFCNLRLCTDRSHTLHIILPSLSR